MWPCLLMCSYTVKVPSGRKPKAASKATAAGTSAADASAGAKPSMSGAQQVTTGVTHVCGPASAAVFGQEFSSSSTQAVSQPGFAPQATQLLSSPLAQSCHNVPVQSAPWQHVQDEHARHQQQRYFGHGLLQQLSHGLTGPEAVPMISTSMLPHNSSAVLEQRSQQYPFQASTRCDKHLMSPPVGLGPTPLCQNIGFTAAAYPLTALPAPLADLLPVPLQGSGCSPVQASCDLAEPARWHPINTLTQQVQPLPPLVLQPTVQQQQSCYQAPSKIPGADYVWPPGSQFTGRPDGDGDSTAAGIGTCTTATESGNPANAPSMFSIGAANVNTTTASYIAPAALQTAAYDYRSEHIPQQQVVSSAAAEDAGGMLHVAPSEGFGRWCTDSITCTGNDRPILAAGRSASASCTTAFGSPHDGHYWPTGSGSGTASCYPLLSCQQNTSHHQSDQLQDVIVALLHDWQQGDGVESTAAGCDGVGDLLGNSWGGEVVSPSSNANISEAELEVLLRDPLAGATTRSALKKRRESDGSSSSDGGGASPSNPAASSGALCPPREYDAKKHVEAMMIFLPAFLKAELAGLDWMDVLRGVLKSLGTVSNMLRLRDFHDRGYGLFNMMLHAAIELGAGDGAEASPGGAAPGGRSTGDVSSGAGNRSSSRELELRLIQAFEVVMERLSEHGTDIPAAQAGKMLLIQQDRDCQDTPNHTCARYNLLTVQHWLLERCDAAMLLVATKDGWLPLATACRCGNLDAAVAYLRRANQLGLCGGRESNGAPLPPDTQQRALQLILSDLTPFNKHYREHNGRAVLEQAIQKVWPHGGAESVFDGFRDAENLKHNAERLQNELQGLGLA
ncbi:hypothetical protein Vretimale_15299 [Volvox reticuliferus]|uniref:Uncharacterized protein n=1 Tax=Volvox reticuliferus TaxID=1737510 RepID=A0A8J4GQZ3_9CHLO|nr:hypothetical protein Vretimale_15299 [Volvox reticuliferus]